MHEKTNAKYAVDANLFRLGFTNPKENYPARGVFSFFLKKVFFSKNVSIPEKKPLRH